jgi:hypothetical protein
MKFYLMKSIELSKSNKSNHHEIIHLMQKEIENLFDKMNNIK